MKSDTLLTTLYATSYAYLYRIPVADAMCHLCERFVSMMTHAPLSHVIVPGDCVCVSAFRRTAMSSELAVHTGLPLATAARMVFTTAESHATATGRSFYYDFCSTLCMLNGRGLSQCLRQGRLRSASGAPVSHLYLLEVRVIVPVPEVCVIFGGTTPVLYPNCTDWVVDAAGTAGGSVPHSVLCVVDSHGVSTVYDPTAQQFGVFAEGGVSTHALVSPFDPARPFTFRVMNATEKTIVYIYSPTRDGRPQCSTPRAWDEQCDESAWVRQLTGGEFTASHAKKCFDIAGIFAASVTDGHPVTRLAIPPRDRSPPEQTGRAAGHKKVGRNDPCLCGSGKKSKKCCSL